MLDVIHLIVTVLSDRPSFECNVTGRPIWFHPLKLTFSTYFRVVVAKHGMDVMLSGGFGRRTVGGAWDGDWKRWLSSSDVTFLQKSQGLVKRHSYFMQAVCTSLWIDCFETHYGSYIAPRPQLSCKKPDNFSLDYMGPLMHPCCIKVLFKNYNNLTDPNFWIIVLNKHTHTQNTHKKTDFWIIRGFISNENLL